MIYLSKAKTAWCLWLSDRWSHLIYSYTKARLDKCPERLLLTLCVVNLKTSKEEQKTKNKNISKRGGVRKKGIEGIRKWAKNIVGELWLYFVRFTTRTHRWSRINSCWGLEVYLDIQHVPWKYTCAHYHVLIWALHFVYFAHILTSQMRICLFSCSNDTNRPLSANFHLLLY